MKFSNLWVINSANVQMLVPFEQNYQTHIEPFSWISKCLTLNLHEFLNLRLVASSNTLNYE